MDQPLGVVEATEPKVADHHGLLEELPLGVAAADPVDLAVDRFHEGEGPGVVSGHVGRDTPDQRKGYRAGDGVTLGVERLQPGEQGSQRGVVAGRRERERGVDVAEDEARARDTGREVGQAAPG